jgi:hypothetical protein
LRYSREPRRISPRSGILARNPRRQEMQARLDALLGLPWAGVVTH